MFAEWGLNQSEYSSRGVPSNPVDHRAFAGNDESRPKSGSPRPKSRENDMKDATKKAASGVLAQMMAVTAMLVIASVVLYGR
jgi:hypothetical protein